MRKRPCSRLLRNKRWQTASPSSHQLGLFLPTRFTGFVTPAPIRTVFSPASKALSPRVAVRTVVHLRFHPRAGEGRILSAANPFAWPSSLARLRGRIRARAPSSSSSCCGVSDPESRAVLLGPVRSLCSCRRRGRSPISEAFRCGRGGCQPYRWPDVIEGPRKARRRSPAQGRANRNST